MKNLCAKTAEPDSLKPTPKCSECVVEKKPEQERLIRFSRFSCSGKTLSGRVMEETLLRHSNITVLKIQKNGETHWVENNVCFSVHGEEHGKANRASA